MYKSDTVYAKIWGPRSGLLVLFFGSEGLNTYIAQRSGHVFTFCETDVLNFVKVLYCGA